MRKLNTADIFAASRAILGSGRLKDSLAELVSKVSSGEMTLDVNKIGILGIIDTLGVLTDADTEVMLYEVLSGPWECSVEDIARMDLTELDANLEALQQDPGLKLFFKRVSGIVSKISSM